MEGGEKSGGQTAFNESRAEKNVRFHFRFQTACIRALRTHLAMMMNPALLFFEQPKKTTRTQRTMLACQPTAPTLTDSVSSCLPSCAFCKVMGCSWCLRYTQQHIGHHTDLTMTSRGQHLNRFDLYSMPSLPREDFLSRSDPLYYHFERSLLFYLSSEGVIL